MFHPFPRLPTELRSSIWELAIFPRLVSITAVVKSGPKHDEVLCIKANTHCPAVMQVCHESRGSAKYLRAFTHGQNPRYTWINFTYDMIACSWDDFVIYGVGEDKFNILRIRLTTDDERSLSWYYNHGQSFVDRMVREDLPCLQEAHVWDVGAQLNVDFYGPNCWTTIELPVSSIQSVDPMTGTVVIDPKQYGCKGEPARNHFTYDNNDRDGSEKDIEVIRKMIHDATSISERHLVRLQIGEDRYESSSQ